MITMTTFVLIPGAGGNPWQWHLVAARLQELGHEVVACDLPNDDDAAGLDEYADAVVAQIGDRSGRADIVLVAHSMGALTAPLVSQRVPSRLIVLVAAMIPAPGEAPGDWWTNTGHDQVVAELAERHGWDNGDPEVTFLHDLPAALRAEVAQHVRPQSATPFERPWPLDRWPDVPTRVVIGRLDRFFPPDFQHRVTRERLGIVPDEIETGHLPMLARPAELADRLDAYAHELG